MLNIAICTLKILGPILQSSEGKKHILKLLLWINLHLNVLHYLVGGFDSNAQGASMIAITLQLNLYSNYLALLIYLHSTFTSLLSANLFAF